MMPHAEACRAMIKAGSKSFAFASKLLPAESRQAVIGLYAWCRRADDAVDNTAGALQARALQRLRSELSEIYAGRTSEDPVLAAFAWVVHEYDIPRQYPEELLAGMEMDATGYRYRSWYELRLYCYRVASTVGLMMCKIMRVSSPHALGPAIHLGIAMQLTNVARDVAEDWRRGRLYLPAELLVKWGVRSEQDGLMVVDGALPSQLRQACRGALAELLDRADSYYRSADEGLRYLDWRCAWAVAAARFIYADIGTQIERADHDVLAPRAVVPGWRKAVLALWAFCRAVLLRGGPRWAKRIEA